MYLTRNILTLFHIILFSTGIAYSQVNAKIPFPEFHLLKMDSLTSLTNKDIAENKNTVFINFSPTCDHCQRTIKNILENISKFRETQFILTSFDNFETVRKFYFDYMLSAYPTVYLGQEADYNVTKQLHYAGFPSVVIFDASKKWIKSIHEETNAKAILKALKLNYK